MYQKVVKVVSKSLVLNPSKWVHILLHSVITVIHFPALGVWSILSHCWTFPDVRGTYRHLSHTVLSCIVSCVRISEQNVWCWWLTGTDFRWLCIKGWVIKWPVRFFNVFFTFFQNPKKHDFLRIFELLHTFSRTLFPITRLISSHLTSWSPSDLISTDFISSQLNGLSWVAATANWVTSQHTTQFKI